MAKKPEKFSLSKLADAMKLNSLTLWVKDIAGIFNFRKLIMYGIILSLVLGVGYYRGYQNRPIKIDLGYNKEAIIEINAQKDYIHIQKNGNVFIKNRKGKVLKQIAIKDIPNLKKILSPFALELKPFVMIGGGLNQHGDRQIEVGVGLQIARAWHLALDVILTTCPAIYTGVSYQITENCYVGGAIGKSLKNFRDTRGIIYLKWKF